MEYRNFGSSDLKVSEMCLGTMTWGEQNSEKQSHELMNYAFENGINFIDVAEMYPVPRNSDTAGRSERFIGSWMKEKFNRDKVVLATKVTGRSNMENFRPFAAETRLNREQIIYAVDQSLKRLGTDYIDIYQLHWPDRVLNLWAESAGYVHSDEMSIPLLETLEVMDELVKAGKIRHAALSNETAWGLMKYMEYHRHNDLTKMMSLQNTYSLLNRKDEQDIEEICTRENIGYLAYSPLAGGVLSGKYRGDALPKGSRRDLFPDFTTRYKKPAIAEIVEEYYNLAQDHGLTLVQLAQKFVTTRPFMTSSIIGATTLDQLEENITAVSTPWTDELEQGVEAIHIKNPSPAP